MIHLWVWQAVLRCLLLFSLLLAASSTTNAQQRFDDKTWSQTNYQELQTWYMGLPGAGVESYSYRPDGTGICLRDDVNGVVTGFGLDCAASYPGYKFLEYGTGSTTVSPNILNNDNWNGATYGADPGGCCSSISGSGAIFDTTTDTIMFSYGTDILTQTIAIQQVMQATGLNVDGFMYDWSWRLITNNGNNNDTLVFDIDVKDANGSVVETYSYNYSGAPHYDGETQDGWTRSRGFEVFSNPLLDPLSASIKITGKDGGFWAGYYGPEVKDVNFRLIYRADPCAADPLYDPSCSGYAEAYAQQQYDQNCSADPMYDPGCPGYAQAYETQQCNADPLYSPSCSGYQQAYYDQQCSLDALYDSGCPGYQTAYYDQQCSADALYDTGCPGYQQAYTDQQCALDPLYDVTCSGYASAYYDQQCSIDALYDSGCPGYASAFYDQQCGLNALYDSGCPGYDTAYYNQQCSINALYDTGCPGYAEAYYDNQCSLDPLYDTGCTGYADAYFSQQCGLDALYDSQCPGYASAYYNQQCGLDSLYDSGCAGYEAAYYDKYIKPELERQAQQASGTDTSDATTPTTVVDATTTEDPVATLTATPATGDATVDQILRETADVSTIIELPGMVETTPPAGSNLQTDTSSGSEPETATAAEPSAEAELEAELASLDEGATNEEEVSESSDNVDESSDEGSDSEGNSESGDGDSGEGGKDEKSKDAESEEKLSPEEAKRKKLKEIATKRAMMLAETMGEAATLAQQQAVQAQIAALINFVPGFNAYGQVGIPGGDMYANQPFYEDKKVPENQRGLRNGLAQQLLHEKMVEQQYENLK